MDFKKTCAMRSKLFQTLVILFTFCGAKGQNSISSEQSQLFQKTPPSPSAGSIAKFLEFPINMSTGLPRIEIPIYVVKSGNISVPISLSYHAGGVKVDEFAGRVGMNWALSVGGVVTRRINGLDDFYGGTPSLSQYGTYINPRYLIPIPNSIR